MSDDEEAEVPVSNEPVSLISAEALGWDDSRALWMASQLKLGLEIEEQMLHACFKRRKAIIEEFMDNGDSEGTILFFLANANSILAPANVAAVAADGDAAPGDAPADEEAAAVEEEATEALIEAPGVKVLDAILQVAPSNVGTESAMFFSRSSPFAALEAGAGIVDMPRLLDFAVLDGQPLKKLEYLLNHVYVPLINFMSNDPAMAKKQTADGGSVQALFKDFMGHTQRFTKQVNLAIQHISSENKLEVKPEVIPEGMTVEQAVLDQKIVELLEERIGEWGRSVKDILEFEKNRQRQGSSPLAEVEYWRFQSAALSCICEQLQSADVKRTLEAAALADVPGYSEFVQTRLSELNRIYDEAKDNVRFLTTLERHFKTISTGTFGQIQETMLPMMNAIRMVWIISRHFNTDDRMVPLMEMIALEIASRVSQMIDVKTILREMQPIDAIARIEEAMACLVSWERTYKQVRQEIEDSARDARWEFDKKKLFTKTIYMSNRCEDLHKVAQVMMHFNNILGAELKRVTGDAVGIENVQRKVDNLRRPLESVPFNVFDDKFQSSWQSVMIKFDKDVEDIENEVKSFITGSFKTKLTSSRGAFNLLMGFEGIDSREALKRTIKERQTDIIEQYHKEIQRIKNIFEERTVGDQIPIAKNQPPCAGSIAWARGLFLEIKSTILHFTNMKEMLLRDEGQDVTHEYVAVARQIRVYEKEKLAQWRNHVDKIVAHSLKKSILEFDPPNAKTDKADRRTEGGGNDARSMVTSVHGLSDSARDKRDQERKIVVNFDRNLQETIREAKYLDRLGIQVPDMAMSVTLQDDRYHKFCESLNAMLHKYHGIRAEVREHERVLLEGHLSQLYQAIKPGFSPLNWNSLSIDEFVHDCTKAINTFKATLKQVQSKAQQVEDDVNKIARAALVKGMPDGYDSSMDIAEFYDFQDTHREKVVDDLVVRYKGITELLGKVEEQVIQGVVTYMAPQMRDYYRYWEQRIFVAINSLVLNGLVDLQNLLNVSHKKQGNNRAVTSALFKVHAELQQAGPSSDVVVSPNIKELTSNLHSLVKRIYESARSFVRWMDGTCQECPPQINPHDKDADPIVISFVMDIMNSQTNKYVVNVNTSIGKVINLKLSNHIGNWSHSYKSLWKSDVKAYLDKLNSGIPPSITQYEAELRKYQKVIQTVEGQPDERDYDFVRLSAVALKRDLVALAKDWCNAIGTDLLKSVQASMYEINEHITVLTAQINGPTDSLENLKKVLNTLSEIKQENMATLLNIGDVEERYSTIAYLYKAEANVSIDADELDKAMGLRARWSQLRRDSIARDDSLAEVKLQYADDTKAQVNEFKKRVAAAAEEWTFTGPHTVGDDLDLGLERQSDWSDRLGKLEIERQDLVNAEKLFNLTITEYPELVKLMKELNHLSQIYKLFTEHCEFVDEMANMLWSDLDANALESGSEHLGKRAKKMDKALKKMSIYDAVVAKIGGFQQSIPLIQSLKNEAMRDRHWDKLKAVTGQESFDPQSKSMKLGSIFAMGLDKYVEEIEEIVGTAMQEMKIEKELAKIVDGMGSNKFGLMDYVKSGVKKNLKVLLPTEEIMQLVDDFTLNLAGMAGSRFVEHFYDEVKKWDRTLTIVSEVIEAWNSVQTKWQYLESIFASDDIRLQLPEEAKNFDRINKSFREIMADTEKEPNVARACTVEGRLALLESLVAALDSCQKGLSDYLDTKRCAFPRFYFISDDELLMILGSSDPQAVQEHMLKLFDNCALLHFHKNGKTILGISSAEKEYFDLKGSVIAEGPVEVWMTCIEKEIQHSLQQIMKEGIWHYSDTEPIKLNAKKEQVTPRVQWLCNQLGMVASTGSQVWWAWQIEDVFERVRAGQKRAMKEFNVKFSQELMDEVDLTRMDISKLERKKINTLIIVDVHSRDIVSSFVRDSVLDAKDFEWESQLRFYWLRDIDDLQIDQCQFSGDCGYEYMGLNGRLVITPLTDRCYMTITTALYFRLGTAPAGPAGTGKTETVKDLAKNMSLYCVVFNCGEGLDYKAMGAIFSGLVQVGAWGCFDEFNRLEAEVLSVVATQIKTIQDAVANGITQMHFEGREISVNDKIGVFITMNPGYAGRTELPDNVKALFRPVVMAVPDLMIICKIWLFSEGFITSELLGLKMTVLYKLAKEQLSKQYHYDWGLRALKSVLVMAGTLKRADPDFPEDVVLMRALRDMNLPKFVYEDVPLFMGLINDLFPGLDCPRVRYPTLTPAIEEQLTAHFYDSKWAPDRVADEGVVFTWETDKCVQLYEVMLTRHTTMIVGPTAGGKSVILNTLCRAQMKAFNWDTKTYTINPKALPVAELYGVMDPVTRDWTDGQLSNIFREINRPLPAGKELRKYIVYDGDVDALWVENMNSVMDDNKLLTLPNGERIQLKPYCAMLFEVYDLQYASPATVSRCGMVYVDAKDLKFAPHFNRWVKLRHKDNGKDAESELLIELFAKYIPPMVAFVIDGIIDGEIIGRPKMSVPQGDINLVQSTCQNMQAAMGKDNEWAPDAVEAMFIFAIVWGIGGQIEGPERVKFDKVLKDICGISCVPGAGPCGPGSLPGDATLFEYRYDTECHMWKAWNDYVTEYVPPANGKFSSILVETVDTVRTTFLLKAMMGIGRPCLFVGETGTSKSVTVNNFLLVQDAEKTLTQTICLSSATSSKDLQANLEENLEKRTKGVYGPSSGRNLICFVDDLNMPKIDSYGTQQPNAILKFVIERGEIYNRDPKDLSLRQIKDMRYVAAMKPPSSGANVIDPRFISLFNCFNVIFPEETALKSIYHQMLMGHAQKLNSVLQDTAATLTTVTLELYNSITEKMPPTPTKFHYIFNLRDLSRLYEGMMQATPDKFKEEKEFIKLWRNESLRIFYDRLITDADKEFVTGKIEELVGANYAESAEYVMADPLVFGDYCNMNAEVGEGQPEPVRLYENLESFDAIKPMWEEALENYNVDNKPMSLVLFVDALEHLTRIERILRFPRGSALLVGVGGSGKQSLTSLASFAAGYGNPFTITLTRGYGMEQFREELLEVYAKLTKGAKMTFMFTDGHVAEEGFLELLNNILNSGMVPALFASEDKDAAVNSVRAEVKAMGESDTADRCWQYYVNKCRDNLHLVCCFSPAGDTLRKRCFNFPGLVNNTTIDWFTPWPEEALNAVATNFLAEEKLPEENRRDLVEHMVYVHEGVRAISERYRAERKRNNYVTPKNYLDFIANYKRQLNDNRKKIEALQIRLSGGLNKIIETAKEVGEMQKELAIKKVEVDENKATVAILIKDIEEKTLIANEKAEIELNAEVVKITAEKEICEIELAAAEPALEAAAAALEKLDKKEIQEIKALKNPPNMVKLTCSCVSALFGKQDSWEGAQKVMGDARFIINMKEFDKGSLSNAKVGKVKKFFKDKNFNSENVQSSSGAAAGMFDWVDAMVKYWDVAVKVEPKRKAVEAAEKKLAQGQRDLTRIQKEVADLKNMLIELDVQYQEKAAELKILVDTAETMERRLTAAEQLIDGLSGERVRWAADLKEFGAAMDRLVGDLMCCSAFLSYTGSFTFEFRQELIKDTWLKDLVARKIPTTMPFSLEKLLTSDVEKSQWESEHLPADELSVQNGILCTRASRFPLCIDPQLQASNWIIQREKMNHLERRSFNSPDYLKILEKCINYGYPMMFEAIDEYIDPTVDPVLEKNIQHGQGGRKFIILGDSEVDWEPSFRCYMTTKLANPHYTPEVQGKTSLINFSVTPEGLASQLLNNIIAFEREDLDQTRKALVQTMSTNKAIIKELEDTLLRELANCTGNILDNEDLLNTLVEAKAKSIEVNKSLDEAKVTSENIAKVCVAYMPAANRGATLFFVMSGMSSISTMYEFALASFLEVFIRSLEDAEQDGNPDVRLQNIISKLTENVFDYTCTGLFEAHKLALAMQMNVQIMRQAGTLKTAQLDFFLKGNVALDKSERKNPWPAWMPDKGWEDLMELINVDDKFSGVADQLEGQQKVWKAWYDLEAPEQAEFPLDYSEKLDRFEQALLLRCFRPDRTFNMTKLYVHETLGEYYIKPPVLDTANVFRQSSCNNPIIFILSPGADPLTDLQKLAKTMDVASSKFKPLSLGQGQGPIAVDLVNKGSEKGHWVILQNCHLLYKWLKTLEKTLENIEKPNKDFRLWLTTAPTENFPLGLLQRSLKVVMEPPDGLALNMRSNYAKISEERLAKCPHPCFRPLVFTLAFFHAVCQERRKFGRIGFNVGYDFNESDFRVSMDLIDVYLAKAHEKGDDGLPWSTLKYLVAEAMYGGRVSDEDDRRTVVCYVNEYMGDFLFDDFQKFHFFHKEGAGQFDFCLPENGPRENFTEFIDGMPMLIGPEVFGMHGNAEITFLTNASKSLWFDLLSMQSSGGGGGGGGDSRDDYIATTAQSIFDSLPVVFDMPYYKKKYRDIADEETNGVVPPKTIVLQQEMDRYNGLIKKMAASLKNVQRALIGEIGMSPELEDLANSLFNGFLPQSWVRLTPATQKGLASWLQFNTDRYKQYDGWATSEEPLVLWLSGLHIPDTYLAALVQTACRMLNWPLDKSTRFSQVTKFADEREITERLEIGCYVRGLYLEGAGWDFDRCVLTRQKPKELVANLPLMTIIPVEAAKLKLQNTFTAAVYVTQTRRNAAGVGGVFYADMQTHEHINLWILQGVCCVLNTDA